MKRLVALLMLAFSPVAAFAQQSTAPAPKTQEQANQMVEMIQAKLRGATDPNTVLSGDGSEAASPLEVGESMVRQITARQREVHELAWPMMVGGARDGLCASAPNTGILIAAFMPGESEGAARVDQVASTSPAADAGVREDDEIVAINGRPVRDMKRGARQLDEAAEDGESITLEIRRDGQQITVTVTPVPACALTVSIFDQASGMLATGDVGQIQISGALYREAQNDDERRIVIAHEIGHHANGHVKTRSRLQKAGRFIDGAAGFLGVPTFGLLGTAGSVATKGGDEREADVASLKFLAYVNVSAGDALSFWERAEQDQGHRFQALTSAHPLTGGRIAALKKAVDATSGTHQTASASDL